MALDSLIDKFSLKSFGFHRHFLKTGLTAFGFFAKLVTYLSITV
ncbi:hypothetical protein HMPREF1557_00238 [Streptococcus sobrinus W1703]|uniref:Uncharacterized protein n=1 Tax=Streptococcus sobrinus W1703 TaxID=1227275 RepID=U2JF62_9STRE|nr:hypothetical protein HMPREF1557_00238 [Streptococcus sobrinus W1703]